jgi:hypothetical protein
MPTEASSVSANSRFLNSFETSGRGRGPSQAWLRLANGFDKKYGRAKEQPCDKRELSCAGARETSALLAGHQGRKLYFGRRTGVPTVKDNIMTVARITEISSVSKESFQDAILQVSSAPTRH